VTDETQNDPAEVVTQVVTEVPDGPTELANQEGPADPNLNPPLTSRAAPSDDKPKAKPEPAYKYDKRKEIYARRSQIQQAEQAASDEIFDEGRATTALPRPTSEERAEPATHVATGDELVTIKVYGEERRVPKAEVDEAGGIAAYQKAAAAAEKARIEQQRARLQAEEQRMLRVAENLRNGLDENGQPLAPKPPPQGVPAISKEALEAAVKGLYSGDAEEAAAALEKLVTQIQGRAGTTNEVSPEVVRAVEARVLERMEERETLRTEEQDVAEANRIFREDFKDIADDPDMMLWAKGLANTLSQDPEYSGKSRSEIARTVGTRIREKLGRPAQKSELDSRRELKRTLPSPNSGSGRVPVQEPKRFPTNADYIQQLRRNSGSNSAPR
jgi:hypothetical protein